VSKEESLKLRVIILSVPLEEWLEDEGCADYELTSPAAHEPEMEYITVSYCWQHEQSIEGLPPTPSYRLPDRSKNEGASRPIKCPSLVFHRAMIYARYQSCPRIWIDQECIDQDNSVDIEKHLQIMHRVYNKSRWTVAVLSRTLQHVEARNMKADFPSLPDQLRFETEQSLSMLKTHVRILQEIAKDRWFTRTWIVQERYCAQKLYLLVPLEPTSVAREGAHTSMLGFNFCLDLFHVQPRALLRKSESSKKILDMRTNMSEAFGFEEMQQLAARYASEKSIYRPGYQGGDRSNSQRLFRETEICDNLLVADRVSILGTICGLPLRLLSNRLDDKNYSYSTCVLALFLANHFPGWC
jgi:hypothetical protein